MERDSRPWRHATGPIVDPILAEHGSKEEESRRWIASRSMTTEDAVTIIRRIHRGDDSYVRFLKKTDGIMRPVTSLRVSNLHAEFPRIAPELGSDAYFSVNSFFRPATTRTKDLRYLNACYVDLDCYSKHEPGSGEADETPENAARRVARSISILADAQEPSARFLPPASFIVSSGRGLWLFWLLINRSTGLPPLCHRSEQYYPKIQRAIFNRIRSRTPDLRPDPAALDASRITRVPGSLHSGAGRKVEVIVQADAQGRGFLYEQWELDLWFGVTKPHEHLAARRFLKTGKRVPSRRAGWDARWRHLKADLERLETLRGGFGEGHRNRAVFLVTYVLRKLSSPEAEIRDAAVALASRCRPKLPKAEALRSALGSGVGRDTRGHITNRKVIDWLAVTSDEQAVMRTLRSTRAPGKRELARHRRRSVIAGQIESGNGTPSTRKMVALLKAAGIRATKDTVSKDYRALGLK